MTKRYFKEIENKIEEGNIAYGTAVELIDKKARKLAKEIEKENSGIDIHVSFIKTFDIYQGFVFVTAKATGNMDKFSFTGRNVNYDSIEDFAKQWNINTMSLERIEALFNYFKEAAKGEVQANINTNMPSRYFYIEPKYQPKFSCKRYIWELKEAISNFLIPTSLFIPDCLNGKTFKDYIESLLIFNNKKLFPKEKQINLIFEKLVKSGIFVEGLNSSSLMYMGEDMENEIYFERNFDENAFDVYTQVWQILKNTQDVTTSNNFIKNLNIPETIAKLAKGDNMLLEKLLNNSLFLAKDKDKEFYSLLTSLDLNWDYGNAVISVVKNTKHPERKIETFNLEFFVK